MKRIILSASIILALGTSLAVGQLETSYGVKAGLNFATVGGSSVNFTPSMTTQYAIGFFDEFHLPGGFSIDPEVYYSVKGFNEEMSSSFFGETFNISATQTSGYLDIPILVKYYLPESRVKLNIYAGPSIGFLLNAKVTANQNGSSTETDIKDSTSSTDVGLVVGAGIILSVGSVDVPVEIRYDFGLSTLDQSGQTNVYNRVVSLLIGVSL
jgi:hypothetical protein